MNQVYETTSPRLQTAGAEDRHCGFDGKRVIVVRTRETWTSSPVWSE